MSQIHENQPHKEDQSQAPTPADPLPLGEGQTANILKLVDEYAKELAYRENPCGMETIEDEERGTLVLAAKWSAVANAIEAITQGTPRRVEGAKGVTAEDVALMDALKADFQKALAIDHRNDDMQVIISDRGIGNIAGGFRHGWLARLRLWEKSISRIRPLVSPPQVDSPKAPEAP